MFASITYADIMQGNHERGLYAKGNTDSQDIQRDICKINSCWSLCLQKELFRDLNHSTWYCKYHAVWNPKCRKKKLFAALRSKLGDVFHELARQKESVIEEGHLMPDHVHIFISIPPKLAVASVLDYLKGKSAIYIARNFCGKPRNFIGENFWARGYYVSTVGLDEESVRKYIQHQEKEDHCQEILRLW